MRRGDLHLSLADVAVPAPGNDTRKYLFVGGAHGSGTSLFYKLLGQRDEFSCFHDTRVVEDEGQKLQDVYPTASRLGGPCRYATNDGAFLDAALPATAAVGTRLLKRWTPWWNTSRPILAEKSPPDAIHSRWLQAAFRGRSTAFVFILKHPYSIVLSGSSAWEERCRRTPGDVDVYLENWLRIYGKLEADVAHLRKAFLLRFEDWLSSAEHARDVFDRLVAALDGDWPAPQRRGRRRLYYHGDRSAPIDIRVPTYAWEPETDAPRLARFEGRVGHFGYSLKGRSLGALPKPLAAVLFE